MWPMGFDVEEPIILAVHLVDGRAIEVKLPPPLSMKQKREFLLKEVGPQINGANHSYFPDRGIEEILQNMLEAAQEAHAAKQLEGVQRKFAMLKSNDLANHLGCEPSVFERYRKLIISEVKVHPDKAQVKLP